MEPVAMDIDAGSQLQPSPDPVPFARRWVFLGWEIDPSCVKCLHCYGVFPLLAIASWFCPWCWVGFFFFPCSYQLEALEKAIHENTIVFLETGSGKTLIAIMLLRSYAYLLRKPSPYIAVFLVPKVVLVTQVCNSLSYAFGNLRYII